MHIYSTENHRTASYKVTVKHGYGHVIKVGHIFGRFRRLGVRLVGRGIERLVDCWLTSSE